jgi:hypothetical protein
LRAPSGCGWKDKDQMNSKQAKEILYNTKHDPDVAEAVGTILDMAERLQRALALASRQIYAENDCPATCHPMPWPECGKPICGRRGPECWQRFLRERARNERVCRICGYTDKSDGLKCTWVEDDICSRCVEK